MKTSLIHFGIISYLVLTSSFLKSQEVSISIVVSSDDTIYLQSNKSFERFHLLISNKTSDTLYLPGFKATTTENLMYDARASINKIMNSLHVQGRSVDFDSVILENSSILGTIYAIVRQDGTDSLVEYNGSVIHEYWLELHYATFDSTKNGNPYGLDIEGFFLYRQMLMLPPHSIVDYFITSDFQNYKFKPNVNYKFSIIYSPCYECIIEQELFGKMPINFKLIRSSIKSNEINLQKIF